MDIIYLYKRAGLPITAGEQFQLQAGRDEIVLKIPDRPSLLPKNPFAPKQIYPVFIESFFKRTIGQLRP